MDALNCPQLWVSFGLNPGGAGAGPWRGWRAVARQNCTPTTLIDDVTSATGPGGLSRRARRSDWLETLHVTMMQLFK